MRIHLRTVKPVLPDLVIRTADRHRSDKIDISPHLEDYSVGQSVRVQVASIHQVLLRRQFCSVNTLDRLIFILHFTALPASLSLPGSPILSHVTTLIIPHRISSLFALAPPPKVEGSFKLNITKHTHLPPTTLNTHPTPPWSP